MIAYGVGKTNGAFVGGHVNNLINIGKQLVDRGHEIDVISIPPVQKSNSAESIEEHGGVTIHTVGMPNALSSPSVSEEGNITLKRGTMGIPLILRKLRELNQSNEYDVIHGHSGYPWVALIPGLAKAFSSAKIVHSLYCPVPDESIPYRTAAGLSLKLCDHIVGISENVSGSVPAITKSNQITIPPLVDRGRFAERNSESSSDEFEILFLGNLSESKGIRTLIRALSKIDEANFQLYLALDMTVEEYRRSESDVKRLIKTAGIEDSVIPVGIVEDLPGLMNRCDVFVAPFNDTQGPADYPIAMLEAMACGLPVVTTPVGGIPELVTHEETGLFAEPGSPESLSEELKKLIEGDHLHQKLSTGGKQVVQSISSEILERHIELYRQ